MNKDKKKKGAWKNYIAFALIILIGFVSGILIGILIKSGKTQGEASTESIGAFLLALVGIYLAVLIQIVIHEAGHLVFGLISGYQFSSFRIMSLMWMKQDGKLKVKRYSLAGTGGQCLMSPPDMVDGRLPVTLYNLGGSLMNVIASALFGGVYLLMPKGSVLSPICLVFILIGIVSAIINGVPMHMGMVDNDGYNAFALRKDKNALRSFWIQLKVNEQISRGIRLKDMPDEWFVFLDDKEMKNTMSASINVFCCNRMMDQNRFEEVNEKMKHFLEIQTGMAGIHRGLMICDRIYCELLEGKRQEAAELMTKEQKSFMKSMKKFPSVLRTNYVYALLCEDDKVKAKEYRETFEKNAKTYPYPSEIQSERELMELAVRDNKV